MKVIDPGHNYALDQLDGVGAVELRFVKRQGPNYPGNTGAHRGTTLQEVCRACIDRVKYVNNQKPHKNNTTIIYMFRCIIWFLEERAFEQHGIPFKNIDVRHIEELPTNIHGHLWI